MKTTAITILLISVLAAPAIPAADQDTEFAVSAVIAVSGQNQQVGTSSENSDGQALPFQPELSLRSRDTHTFAAKFGFAVGNGLNASSPFVIPSWAADVEDDVKDINGRSRDYLLTAWYKFNAAFSDETSVAATVGVIDATDYLDDNVFSNDEYGQFMNGALVNAPNMFLPSYDAGAALELETGHWGIRGVYMNVGENDDGNNYNFAGVQLGYRLDTRLGTGNYRILGAATDKRFLGRDGSTLAHQAGVLMSIDQQLGGALGAYLRLAVQDDLAAIDYGQIYSGGINISGGVWGRTEDTIGVGYATLNGGNGDIDGTQVGEMYYRLALNNAVALTADVQYMADTYRTEQDGPQGWILGVRMATGF